MSTTENDELLKQALESGATPEDIEELHGDDAFEALKKAVESGNASEHVIALYKKIKQYHNKA